jgi:hypothetical protein
LTAVVSLALAAATSPPLRVEITNPKKQVGVFEPVKLTIRATANQQASIASAFSTAGHPVVETWIDYGSGFVRYSDMDGCCEGVVGARLLKPGDSFVKTIVLVDGHVGQRYTVPFPRPGRHALRVVVRGASERDPKKSINLGESRPIWFEVVAPNAAGQGLVERIRHRPGILRAAGGVDDAEFRSLHERFPGSPYLLWGKHAVAIDKAQRIGNGQYPDSEERFASLGRGPVAESLFRELATELLNDDWGQFDEERLALAAESLERGKALGDAKEVWAQIADRFPGSEAAEEARRLLRARDH